MLNVYYTPGDDWYLKIVSLMPKNSYQLFDKDNYPQAGDGGWVIALESGDDRLSVMNTELGGASMDTFFKGCNNLDDVTIGKGLTVGCCSLIRPGSVIGDQVYIGAGTIIDINCTIEDGVTIGDNVTIAKGVHVPANTNIPSGSVVQIDND
jgi:acetyltransferase-like isoleucine patch superfamily enzyme